MTPFTATVALAILTLVAIAGVVGLAWYLTSRQQPEREDFWNAR